MRTSLDFPDTLFRYLKTRAALEGSTLRDLVLNLIERGINAHTSAPDGSTPIDTPTAVVSPLPSLSLGEPMALSGDALSNANLVALLNRER